MNFAPLARRDLIKAGGTLSLAAPFAAIMEAQARAATTDGNGAQLEPVSSPYGPIAPVRDQATGLFLLQLPRGFTYRSLSWRGDMMNDGFRVGPNHDGMAVVQMTGGRSAETLLIRNHENATGQLLDVPGGVYDPVFVPPVIPGIPAGKLAGGCTVLRMRNGQLVDHRAVIGGTVANCAGGRTLWNSWLTCEETTESLVPLGGKKHGYIFDVSSDPRQTSAVPLVAMGRFAHEAVASDPVTGFIYETEDARNVAGFYRFRPNSTERRYGALEQGGVLEAAKIVGTDRANLLHLADSDSAVRRVGDSFDIEWITITEPDADRGPIQETAPVPGPFPQASGPYIEARSKGALRMSRGEGIWWDHMSGCFYVVDTSFGTDDQGRPGRGLGAVWAYHPDRSDPAKGRLTLVYAAAARVAGNNPDNITVSPRGGLLTCDDGSAVVDQFGPGQRLMGFRDDGLAYIFAKSHVMLSPADIARAGRTGQFDPGDYRGAEFAGATFDWSGRTLYVNNYTPGITFAITGPWGRGNL